jgi:hypothetical protein
MSRLLLVGLIACCSLSSQPWRFAVSGDSRNCGDVVMPAIASGVLANRAEFYWHLGDFRKIYAIDEDLAPPAELHLPPRVAFLDYYNSAWPDFISHQLGPFGSLPIFLSIGNHETIMPMDRDRYRSQFARWLDAPPLRAQRLADNPNDREPQTYYHWISHNIDFIALDNASVEQFDAAQLAWFHALIARDEASSQIRTIVVGMHAALPGSFGRDHSMSDWAQGETSGRDVYRALWHAQNSAHKRVYVLASHSHFFMEKVFETSYWKGEVLPGWIIGTAGAVRYRLPPGADKGRKAATDVYGYLLATVADDSSISFAFQQLGFDDLLRASQDKQPESLVRWCVDQNKQ